MVETCWSATSWLTLTLLVRLPTRLETQAQTGLVARFVKGLRFIIRKTSCERNHVNAKCCIDPVRAGLSRPCQRLNGLALIPVIVAARKESASLFHRLCTLAETSSEQDSPKILTRTSVPLIISQLTRGTKLLGVVAWRLEA